MPSHHPPRACFKSLTFYDLPRYEVDAIFTEQKPGKPPTDVWYQFKAPGQISWLNFRDNPTGTYFNATVRPSSAWTFVRKW